MKDIDNSKHGSDFFLENTIYEISNIYDSLKSFNQLLVSSFYQRCSGCSAIIGKHHFIGPQIFPCISAVKRVYWLQTCPVIRDPSLPINFGLCNHTVNSKGCSKKNISEGSDNEAFLPHWILS